MKKYDALLRRLFVFNYILVLISVLSNTLTVAIPDATTGIFVFCASLSYAFLYLLPAALLIIIAKAILSFFDREQRRWPSVVLFSIAVLSYTATNLLLLVDKVIFKMYGFHLNGFVWNIITTKGGIESMGADTSTIVTFFIIIIAILLLEIGLLLFSRSDKLVGVKRCADKTGKFLPYIAVLLFLVQGGIYGVSEFFGKSPVLVATAVLPQYQPITFKGQLEKMGFEAQRKTAIEIEDSTSLGLNYPLNPIQSDPEAPKYNVVWLVAESWRADMLTEDIMPNTWQFAKGAQHFLNHYSSGNGTRMALFGMFYGLYGNYWFNFLHEQRPPVVMDFFKNNNYQIELFTSARFSYPEFDKTLFAGIAAKHLHEEDVGQGWERDKVNIDDILASIDTRDKSRPFMRFMFFESPHARYYFPPECEIRKDYLEDFNYATVDLEKDIELIWNRYINSCNHLDTQIARVTNYLRDNDLLVNTIVIITGDHGEEFMEHGRWGHNSAFVEQQVRTPMVVWVPGIQPAEYTKVTSHLDIPETILQILGVTNPASDYSLGHNMFGKVHKEYEVLADWDSLCYLDDQYKVVLPLKSTAANSVTTRDDKPVEDPSQAYSAKMPKLLEVMKESKLFTSNSKKR